MRKEDGGRRVSGTNEQVYIDQPDPSLDTGGGEIANSHLPGDEPIWLRKDGLCGVMSSHRPRSGSRMSKKVGPMQR